MNEGYLFLALLCVGMIVVAAIVAIVLLLNKDRKNKPGDARRVIDTSQSQSTPDDSARPTRQKDRRSWIPYSVAALILAIWTIWGALFFLAVVWIMRTNPSSDASFTLSNNEKSTARRVYTWLFFSPAITVPTFISVYLNVEDYGTNAIVFAALVPLIFHAPVLLGLTSKSAFVFRHTQQGTLLIALRAGVASLVAISLDYDISLSLGLFLLGNGTLWLVGSIVGWSQISSGKCWLMQRKGETITTIADEFTLYPANIHLEKSRAFIMQFKKTEAYNHALAAFRNGDREIKQQAVQLLETLDEVEQF